MLSALFGKRQLMQETKRFPYSTDGPLLKSFKAFITFSLLTLGVLSLSRMLLMARQYERVLKVDGG